MSVTEKDPANHRPRDDRSGLGIFEWVGRHVRSLVTVIIIVSVALGIAGFVSFLLEEDRDGPAFNPGGEIYEIADRVDELFDPATEVLTAIFFVEAKDPVNGDVLTRVGLSEFLSNTSALLADADSQSHLTSTFDSDLGVPVDGVFSIAHAIDDHLTGGLAAANDADVKRALSEILDDNSPQATLRATLSQLTTSTVEDIDGNTVTVWRSPAFQAEVAYLRESFEIEDPDTDNEDFIEYQYAFEGQTWLREAQTILRGDQQNISVLGLAIDGILTEEEQSEAAGPFIMGAIVLIVLLVGALVRSYWASAIVATGLSVTFLAYSGIVVLIGLKNSILLTFIIPIAVLSFGVDFFIHGFGRCREEQEAGTAPLRAYPLGMSAVAAAVLLAVTTSAAAFLSNVSSGIEAIRDFGIAAAIGLLLAYLFLGVIGPRVVLGIEQRVGPPPRFHGPRLGAKVGFVVMSLIGGLTVTFSVILVPFGVFLLIVVFIPLVIYLPYRRVIRRNRKAAENGRQLDHRIRGAGHGLKSAGSVVHFVARWRVVTVPVTVILALLGLYGFTQVEEKFKPSDFTSSKTDFIQSLNALQLHYGTSTGTNAYLYVEGDLTEPATLAAMDTVIVDVDAADAKRTSEGGVPFLARDFDGTTVTASNATDIVRAALASPDAVTAIEASTGVTLEEGSDGLPEGPNQVAAIYQYASESGIPGPGGTLLWRPEDVQAAVHVGDGFQATRVDVALATVSDLELMAAARDALQEASVGFDSATPEFASVGLSGDAIADEDTLTAFTASMVLSLLIALGLCALIAWAFMRSLKYALVSVIPILLVVGWVYLFMYLYGYSINPVTATIAAIAVGVGVDFAMHFTMRFREEFVGEPSRFPALRRAGEGTGGALVLSALTSMGGFLVMSRAPMPVFADFGFLTAVMIFFSLVVALLVLPSLLLLVTPSRQGEERQEVLEALRSFEDSEYDPHSRRTALETAHH
ncbi:MAG: MMPL family transporter [bacterium]|nr:MMPL family transporter [bacterium]